MAKRIISIIYFFFHFFEFVFFLDLSIDWNWTSMAFLRSFHLIPTNTGVFPSISRMLPALRGIEALLRRDIAREQSCRLERRQKWRRLHSVEIECIRIELNSISLQQEPVSTERSSYRYWNACCALFPPFRNMGVALSGSWHFCEDEEMSTRISNVRNLVISMMMHVREISPYRRCNIIYTRPFFPVKCKRILLHV